MTRKSLFAADRLGDLRAPDPHIQALANGYRNTDMTAIDRFWPIVPVPKMAGTFTNWSPDPFIPIDLLRVGTKTRRVRLDIANGRGSYATARYEVEVAILDSELEEIIADDRETFIEKKGLRGEAVVQLGMEAAVANKLQDAASYDTNNVQVLTGGNQWGDKINSDPIALLRPIIARMRRLLSMRSDQLGIAFGQIPFDAFKDHPKVLSRAVGTTGKEPNEARLAEILSVGEVTTLPGSYFVTIDEKNPDNNVAADLYGDVVVVYPILKAAGSTGPVKVDPDTPLPGAIVRHENYPQVDDYIDQQVSGGPAQVKVTKENWGIVQISKTRLYLIKAASGLSY